MKKRIAALVLLIVLVFSVTACLAKPGSTDYSDDAAEKVRLAFDENGDYRILQMTDIQFVTAEIDAKSVAVMDKLIENADPDLIVITGDLSSTEMFINYAGENPDALKIHANIAKYFESKMIPWTLVFGNHDGLGPDTETELWKERILKQYENTRYFLSDNVEDGAFADLREGASDQIFNFSMPVKDADGKIVFDLLGLDTGTCISASANDDTYVPLNGRQKDFYNAEIERLKALNGGAAVPTLLFTHQPLDLYNAAYRNRRNSSRVLAMSGDILDSKTEIAPNGICSPTKGYALFEDNMLEKKNVAGVFVGHDHLNTFTALYQAADDYSLVLSYGRISAFGLFAYPPIGFTRGGRAIDLKSDGTFSTTDIRCAATDAEITVFGYEEADTVYYGEEA